VKARCPLGFKWRTSRGGFPNYSWPWLKGVSVSPSRVSSPLQQAPPKSSPTILQPATTDEFNFRFSADRDFKDKFERLAEVLGVENAQKHMADILEKALDTALEKKDPKKKLERRQKRDKKREASTKAKSRPNEMAKNEPAKSRYIASEVSERVHARAGYVCEHYALDGRRCTSRTGLQIEHVRPFGIFQRLSSSGRLNNGANVATPAGTLLRQSRCGRRVKMFST